MFRSAATGAVLTIVLAFPVAFLFALFFRMFGKEFNVAFMLFAIIEGEFVVLAALGAASGAVAHEIAKHKKQSPVSIRLGLALVAAVAAGFVWLIMVD